MEQVFQELIREAKGAGKSVLLSSHILSEVEKLCDIVSIIRQGRIIESGTLQELRHLTRTRVHVETARPVPNFAELEGIHDLNTVDRGVVFHVDTDKLGQVIRDQRVRDLEPGKHSATLEDLFIHHYRDQRGGLR